MNAENHVGRTIAGYRLVKHIGEGGTATVYRAEHPDQGLAAVKVLRPRLAQDPVAVKRFLREAEFGKRVVHPKIVQTYDYGESEGVHFLALEWAEGEPLANFAQRAGQLAPTLVASIIEQIGAALSGELVNEQADVYSLATIAYNLLTGEIPFTGRSPRELFQQLLSQAPVPLNQAAKGAKFSPALEAVVMRGLERDRGKRYKTVDEFTSAFCTAARDERQQKSGFLSGLFGRK